MAVIHVSDKDFATQVLQSDKPVLVDFWAEWCTPCKAIAPVLEEIAVERSDSLTIAKLNIDENPDTPQQYKIRGIPTLLLFKGGKRIAVSVGAQGRHALDSWLEENLA